MKVVILTGVYPDENGFQGGIFIHNQAKAIAKAGVSVCVLYYDFRSVRRRRKIGLSKYWLDGIEVYRIAIPCGPIKPVLNFLNRWIVPLSFRYIIKKTDAPDLINAHFWDAGFISSIISASCGIPYVVTEHSSGILTNTLSVPEKKKAKEGYDKANLVIAVSKALKSEIHSITNTDVITIPNIVPEYMFNYKDTKVDNNRFTFITVCNLIPSKRVDLTIKAFSILKKSYEELHLLIVGEGPLKTELYKQSERDGCSNDITFLGQVDNKHLESIYKSCNCFVLPSDFETFGVVFAEALANGLPVITSNCGGPEEFVCEENGIVVTKNNIEELVNAMEYMVNNYEEYDRHGLSQYAKNLFSEDSVSKKIIEAFSSSLRTSKVNRHDN